MNTRLGATGCIHIRYVSRLGTAEDTTLSGWKGARIKPGFRAGDSYRDRGQKVRHGW